MKRFSLLGLLLFASLFTANAQYKNDNKLFKTVYMDDLCAALRNNPGHLLLDVRSPGEYSDTSTNENLNIGHLKNAKNINIREMPTRWHEIESYKDKPVFVYCSHSQRSRRVSKLLSDSGFTNIININGGLSTFNLLKQQMADCAPQLYESNNIYQLVAPATVCRLNKSDYVLLDVRNDSVYKGIASDEYRNAYGLLKQAIHIQSDDLPSSYNKLPKDKTIILVDEFGSESPKVARYLHDKGFKNLAVMFAGMEGWMGTSSEILPCRNEWQQSSRKYKLVPTDDLEQFLSKNKETVIIDIRKEEEFNNKSTETFRNVGNLKGARSYPAEKLESFAAELEPLKNKPVLLYGFAGSSELFTSAQWLSEKGFNNVNILLGGIFNVRWRANNIKNRAYLANYVVNVPAENL